MFLIEIFSCKPHIYLHKYQSGVRFWRVSMKGYPGYSWHRLNNKHREMYKAALQKAYELNLLLNQKDISNVECK